jgi:uncharacterized protein (TIGR03067 family)
VITSHLESGKPIELKPKQEWIISGREVQWLVDGQVRGKGKLTLDIEKSPKRLHLTTGGGPNDADFVIFTLEGKALTTCGNRQRGGDAPPYPEKFSSGTPKGGDYLIIWQRR